MDVFSPAQLLGYLAFVLGVVAFAQRIDWRLKLLVATSWTAVFAIGAGLAGTVAAFFLTGIGLRALLLVATLCWLTNNRLSGSIGGTLLESTIAVVNTTTILRLWRNRYSTGSMGRMKKKLLPRDVAS
ncbi:MAG: YgjV family protein [Desulfovibrionaceae bacterium]